MDNQFPTLPDSWRSWQITDLLGEGSYGSVYKAERDFNGTKEFCAIKIVDLKDTEHIRNNPYIKNPLDEYASSVNDSISEIITMLDLRGITNIVTIFDSYTDRSVDFNWRLFIRMELLSSLNDYQTSLNRLLTEKEQIKLGIDICTALSYCSRSKILHRDIKPDNIFVSKNGDFKLGDFGEAKVTDGSVAIHGTYSYMAPEVYHLEKKYDTRVDIYSLGIVLYSLSNTKKRFPFENTEAKILNSAAKSEALAKRMSGVEEIPAPTNASPEFARVILKAIAYNPDDRYSSAEEFMEALRSIGRPDASPPASQSESSTPESKKTATADVSRKTSKILWILFIIIVIAAISLLFITNDKKAEKIKPDVSSTVPLEETTDTVPTSEETKATSNDYITDTDNKTEENLTTLTSNRLLSLGTSGEDVSMLQKQLAQLNFYSGEINGIFDDATHQAVVSFQNAVALYADGIVGPVTINALNSIAPDDKYIMPEANDAGNEFGETTWNNVYLSVQRTGSNTATLTATSYATGETIAFGPWVGSQSTVTLTGADGSVAYAFFSLHNFFVKYQTRNLVTGQTYTIDLTFDPAVPGEWQSVQINIDKMSNLSETFVDIYF